MRAFTRVAVVGLGRMGLPMACIVRDRGYEVVGIDSNDAVRAQIARAELPYDEPGLDVRGLDVRESSRGVSAEVWIIAVGTTSDGLLDDGAVLDIARDVAERPGTQLIVVESTISPSTAVRLRGLGVGVAVCPERARPGQVLRDFDTVPRLVGGVSEESTEVAASFYHTLTTAPVHTCTAEQAALAKLAENAEREVRIAFANEVADVARRYGVDAEAVLRAANTHPRTALLRPGIGVGGHCLPMATTWFASHADGVAAASRRLHRERPMATARRITQELAPGAKVCVLGRTYRPNTAYQQPLDGVDPYQSPAVALIDALRELGFVVTSWDPGDPDGTREEAEAGADLVFVAVPHDTL